MPSDNEDNRNPSQYLGDTNHDFSYLIGQEIRPSSVNTGVSVWPEAGRARLDHFVIGDYLFTIDPAATDEQALNELLTTSFSFSPAQIKLMVQRYQQNIASLPQYARLPFAFEVQELFITHGYGEGVRRDVRIQWATGQGNFSGYSDGIVAERVGSVNYPIGPFTFIQVSGGDRRANQIGSTVRADLEDVKMLVFDDVEYALSDMVETNYGAFERNILSGPTGNLAGEHMDVQCDSPRRYL